MTRTPRSIRVTRAGSVTAALAAVALAVPAGGAPAVAAASEWTRVDWPASVRPLAALTAVSAGSATRAFAVGEEYAGTSVNTEVPGVPLVLRMNGTRWTKVALPAITWKGSLTSVAAVGPGRFWATGKDADGRSHVLLGTPDGVEEVALPAGFPATADLRVFGAVGRRPWLLGGAEGIGTFLYRRTATGWAQEQLPAAPFVTRTIEVTTGGDVWAAGFVPQTQPGFPFTVPIATAQRRTGATWTSLPPGPTMSPADILPSADGGVWLSGAVPRLGPGPVPQQGAIAAWDGTAWRTETLPGQNIGSLYLSGDDAGEPEYATGTFGVVNGAAQTGYLKYEAGAWTRIDNAPVVDPEAGSGTQPLTAITHLPGTDSTIAVGRIGYVYQGQYAPRIEREDAP